MLPFMTVYRAANITQDIADDLLAPLKLALTLPRKLILGSVAALFISVCGFCCCLAALKKPRKEPIPSLLESSENVFAGH